MRITYEDLYLLYISFFGIIVIANIAALLLKIVVILFFKLSDFFIKLSKFKIHLFSFNK